jgi:hypothetical protein
MGLRAVVASVLTGIWLSSPAAAEDAGPRLSDLVAYIPDAAEYYAYAPIFTYLDLRALERATGAPTPRSEAEYAGAGEIGELWRSGLFMRGAVAPPWMSFLLPALEPGPSGLADAIGVDFFDIDRSLTFGGEQLPVTMLLGDAPFPERERVQAALEARGFALETTGEVPIWHRFEDGENSIADRNLSDPFGGHIGAAARIALLPGLLVGAPTWVKLQSVLSAPTAPPTGSRMSAELEAAVQAVEAFGGKNATVLQAQALPMFATYVTRTMLDRAWAALNGASPDKDPVAAARVLEAQIAADENALPKYLVALLADLQIGDEQVDVIALSYLDETTAARAAARVSERLRRWTRPGRTGEGPVLAQVGATLDSQVVAVGNVAVALIAARYPSAKASTRLNLRGSLLPVWMTWIGQSEFNPLAASD